MLVGFKFVSTSSIGCDIGFSTEEFLLSCAFTIFWWMYMGMNGHGYLNSFQKQNFGVILSIMSIKL